MILARKNRKDPLYSLASFLFPIKCKDKESRHRALLLNRKNRQEKKHKEARWNMNNMNRKKDIMKKLKGSFRVYEKGHNLKIMK